jgi:hypothetical protein
MVEILDVSAVVAAAGVLIGIIYYVLDIRNQTRIRQTDFVIRLYSVVSSKEFLEAWEQAPGFWWAQARPCKRPSGQPLTVPGE